MKAIILKTTLVTALTVGMAESALAHANFIPKDNLDMYSGRDYKEGSSAFLSLNLSHGCSNADGETFATKHAVAIMPNDQSLAGIAFTKDRMGNRYGANGVMSVRPEADANWKRIEAPKATVGEYYSHGLKTEDIAAIQWKRGNIPANFYASVNFRVALPYLESCVSKIKVQIPTVQYCTSGYIKAWIKEPTPSMPTDVISTGYAPYFNIVRADNNPLGDECGGVGTEEEVYPSTDQIENNLISRRGMR